MLSSGTWHHVWKCRTDISRGSCCLHHHGTLRMAAAGQLTDYRDSHPTKHCSRHTIIKWPAKEFVMQQQEWSDEAPACGNSHSPVVAHLDCREVWSTGGRKTSTWDKVLREKPAPVPPVHSKSHMNSPGTEPTPLQWEVCNWLPELQNGPCSYSICITLHQCNTS
jgi:hypothetical protein